MHIESLRVFCDVARCRSFSQAAIAHHLTQSAVSQIVLQLEKRLGVQLIDRSTRPLQLTTLGRTYYDGCRGLVEQYSELESSIRARFTQMTSTVEVAAIYSVGLGDMGQYVERFTRRYPDARVHVDYLHPDRVYEKVLDGTSDLGLVSFPKKSRELTSVLWRDEEMMVVCSPRHPLSEFTGVYPAQMQGAKVISFTRELLIRRMSDRFWREQEVNMEVAVEFDNIENIKKAVEIDAGVALLPEPTVRKEVALGSLRALRLEGCTFVRPLGIIRRRNRRLGSSAQRFMEMLRLPLGDFGEPKTESLSLDKDLKPKSAKRCVV